jgi:hypothetical protein
MENKDLLVMLSHNKYADVLNFVQGRVEVMIMDRHNYPMWPAHGGNPIDAFEEEFHGRSRQVYYDATKDLIYVLRQLRNIS